MMEVQCCLQRVRVIYDAVTPGGDSEIVEAYREFSSSQSLVVISVEEK